MIYCLVCNGSVIGFVGSVSDLCSCGIASSLLKWKTYNFIFVEFGYDCCSGFADSLEELLVKISPYFYGKIICNPVYLDPDKLA